LKEKFLKAVILAAGASTRTRPLTYTRPKPLLPFFEKTFLEYTLDCLVGLVSEVIIAEHFLSHMIQEKIGNEYKGMKIHHIEMSGTPGTAGTISQIREMFEPPFLVLNGDDIYSKKDIQNLLKHERAVLISDKVEQTRTLDGWNVRDGHVVSLGQKEDGCEWGVATGAYVLSQDYFELPQVKLVGKNETGLPQTLVQGVLQNEYKAVFVEDFWFPVGYAWDLLKLYDAFWHNKKEKVFLGKNVKIGKNTKLARTIIFDNAVIGDDCVITDSVIGAYAKIGNDVSIQNAKDHGTWHVQINGEDLDTDEATLGIFVGDYSTIESGSVLLGGTFINPPQDKIPR
jgi:NDP-sugar pyrophosphorylase family protein